MTVFYKSVAHDQECIYTQLSAETVSNLVAANYELHAPVHCKFYVLGLHDNYLIECEGRRYIFRIYSSRRAQ